VSAALGRLYRRTDYIVLLDPPLRLRCGPCDAAAEARLLAECGLRRRWALLTACNPRSRRLGGAANRVRQRQLRQLLRRLRYRTWPTAHRDLAGRWPDEAGVLLIDAPRRLVMRLARRFRQNAWVSGGVGAKATLQWVQRCRNTPTAS
jgi:hypothetical protein